MCPPMCFQCEPGSNLWLRDVSEWMEQKNDFLENHVIGFTNEIISSQFV